MLVNVCLHSGNDRLTLRCLLDEAHDLGVLQHGGVHRNVSLMILLDERFGWLPSEHVLVLLHRIGRRLIVFDRHELG